MKSDSEAWFDLPTGSWFVMESSDVIHKYSVMERTRSGYKIVCSCVGASQQDKENMDLIAGLHCQFVKTAIRCGGCDALFSQEHWYLVSKYNIDGTHEGVTIRKLTVHEVAKAKWMQDHNELRHSYECAERTIKEIVG